MFPDSKIAQHISCGRTKASRIVSKVLASHSLEKLISELQDIRFISVSTDASNHGAIKLFPVLIQYYNYKNGGTQTKVLEVTEQKNETSDTIVKMLVDLLRKYKLLDKVKCFSGDNCNTNFGGVDRNGTNNVYHKLKTVINENLVGLGCPVHVVSNATHQGLSQLDLNVDGIVLKLHNYFSIFTIRVGQLKDFCVFTEIEYKPLLFHSKTRWLSLSPAVRRILDMYDALKSYFLSIDKPPKVIKDFFLDEFSEPYLWLVH